MKIDGVSKQFNLSQVLSEIAVESDEQLKPFHDAFSNFQSACYLDMFLTEIIDTSDPRCDHPEFDKCKRNRTRGTLKEGGV